MRLNCVILNYNDGQLAAALAKRMEKFQVLSGIVLVDNASTDDSWELLQQAETETISAIRAERNGGYGAGNNLGVRYAVEHNGATHVVIANSDVECSESCLLAMLRIFAHHPETGVVSARMEDARYGDLKNGWPFRGYWMELFAMGPISRRIFRRLLEYPEAYLEGKKAVWADVVHGSLLMVDGEKFLQCGGYDEAMFLYQEESVLARRMQEKGWRTVLLLNCSYRHEHSVSISRAVPGQLQRQRLREQSLLYYMKRYLKIGKKRELFARFWFWGIRMEIRAAAAAKAAALFAGGGKNSKIMSQ